MGRFGLEKFSEEVNSEVGCQVRRDNDPLNSPDYPKTKVKSKFQLGIEGVLRGSFYIKSSEHSSLVDMD